MYPELFKIGNLTIYTHGVLAVLGIIVGSYILLSLAKKSGLDTSFLFDNIVYSVLVGIIGARLTYFFLYREQFDSFSEIIYLWQGGMVSYGGFIPGFMAFFLLLKSQKTKISDWLAISSIAFPAGLFFGRLGNIFAGEYAGFSTNSKINLDGFIPVTLYEGILVLLLAVTNYFLYRKNVNKGNLFAWFIFSYSLGRFIIDFWRDEGKLILNISTGQAASLILGAVAIALFAKSLLIERCRHKAI